MSFRVKIVKHTLKGTMYHAFQGTSYREHFRTRSDAGSGQYINFPGMLRSRNINM